ncbi:MAG: hypothetical protein JOY96_03770, partial [Verrucomicrobia bacterium]|nr:hypothetical protein [Verrucomicrobiota bacterium]
MANPAVDFHLKTEVRAFMRERLSQLDSAERRKRSLDICFQLAVRLQKAKSLALFAPRSTEPDLDLLWHNRLPTDLLRLYPRCIDNSLQLCPVSRIDQLQLGAFGLREPLALESSLITPEFILVPGLGFTSDGKR